MGDTKEPKPVQLFCGVIYAPRAPLVEIKSGLEKSYGQIDFESAVFDFDFTDYYSLEMGEGLKKIFYAFEKLIPPHEISDVKLKTNEMENRFRGSGEAGQAGGGRLVNLDPGYVTLAKMVLATTKDFYHRISLPNGIFAEVTLNYRKRTFSQNPWTYPDYTTPEYMGFFNELRARYKSKIESAPD
jgi:hypothetical protein